MRASSFVLAVAAVSSLAVAPAAFAHDGALGQTSCAVARVFSPDLPRTAGGRPRFDARQVVGIEFEVAPARLAEGAHRLELRVYTPHGFLYQSLRASLTVEPRSRHRGEQSPRRPEPVRLRLTVPGSPIVTHSLYGRWQVTPYLDGAPDPCGRSRRFWIESGRADRDGRESDDDDVSAR